MERSEYASESREVMEDFELFATKEAAQAFVQGYRAAVDLIDDDHAYILEPYLLPTGEWRVCFGHSR
jgi:hypothetical protein